MPDVILPVLDEAAAIPGVLAAMPAGYRPIVVDNGSTDGSGAIAAELGAPWSSPNRAAASAPPASPASAPPRPRSSASWTATARSTPPTCRAWSPCSTTAPTSRSAPGAPRRGAWPLHARVANRVLACELRRRTGVALADIGPMRAARRQPLLDLDLRDRRSGWPLEMVVRAVAAGWSVVDAPVPYAERAGPLEGHRHRPRDDPDDRRHGRDPPRRLRSPGTERRGR